MTQLSEKKGVYGQTHYRKVATRETALQANKCCDADQQLEYGKCISSTQAALFSPQANLTIESGEQQLSWKTMLPRCSEGFSHQIIKASGNNFILKANGTETFLQWMEHQTNKITTQYCIDLQHDSGYDVIICKPDKEMISSSSPVQEWHAILSPIFLIISIIFLILLVVFHLLLSREILNYRHQGALFLSYTVSLLMAFAGSLANLKFAEEMSYSQCIITAVITQYGLLAAFFWLHVMSIDIWIVVRGSIRGRLLRGILLFGCRRFPIYSSYAFGCPLVISSTTLAMQLLPNDSSLGLVVPGFGKEGCWFPQSHEMPHILYLHLFVALLSMTSFVLLCLTHIVLHRIPYMYGCITPHARRNAIFLFNKRLAIYTAVVFCWLTDALCKVFPNKDARMITDLLNNLQGFFIFIIFITNRRKNLLLINALGEMCQDIHYTISEFCSDTGDSQDNIPLQIIHR